MSQLHLDVEPVMYVIRGYRDPQGREKGHASELMVNIFMLGAGRARAFAAMGEMGGKTVTALADKLHALGVSTLLIRRHGVEQTWVREHGRFRKVEP